MRRKDLALPAAQQREQELADALTAAYELRHQRQQQLGAITTEHESATRQAALNPGASRAAVDKLRRAKADAAAALEEAEQGVAHVVRAQEQHGHAIGEARCQDAEQTKAALLERGAALAARLATLRQEHAAISQAGAALSGEWTTLNRAWAAHRRSQPLTVEIRGHSYRVATAGDELLLTDEFVPQVVVPKVESIRPHVGTAPVSRDSGIASTAHSRR